MTLFRLFEKPPTYIRESEMEALSKNQIPSWLKLDHAAIIYPPTTSRRIAAMFRLSVSLDHTVDKDILKAALQNTLRRIPSFGYRLRQGLFWWYFTRLDAEPEIKDDANNPMLRIDEKRNRYYLFRLRCYENRIALEVYHALADGTGGLTFLMTLTAEYLRLKCNDPIEYSDIVLNPSDAPDPEEYEDSYIRFSRKAGAMEQSTRAYHVPGAEEDPHILNLITGKIPLDELKSTAKAYNCHITSFLCAVMIDAIQQIQEENAQKKHPIIISVPVNLRQFYPTKTLRNFSSYLFVGIDPKLGHYSFDEIVSQVSGQMSLLATEKRMNAKMTANVQMTNNIFFRAIPTFIKKPILSVGELLMGDRCCSNSLSNLGYVSLPDTLEKHIDRLNFMLGRPRAKPGSTTCVGYGNNLYITFSRKIKETDTEKYFFQKLVQLNIPVEIESNHRS